MIQFDETLTRLHYGQDGAKKEIENRLLVRYDEIPYFNGGIVVDEFVYDNSATIESIKRVLGDFDTTIRFEEGRVVVGNIEVKY